MKTLHVNRLLFAAVAVMSVGKITFGSASGAIALTGGTITLAATGTNSLTADAGRTITQSGTSVLANPTSLGTLSKGGDGSPVLAGNNTYTGVTNVNAGSLPVNGANSGTGMPLLFLRRTQTHT